MAVFYGLISGFFIVLGIFRLQDAPAAAIHNFLIGLYFFMTLYALIGKPFPRRAHMALAVGLLGDAGLQFYVQDVLSGVISLLFAYFAYIDRNRFASS